MPPTKKRPSLRAVCRLAKKLLSALCERQYGVVFVPPAYLIRSTLNEDSVVVDCGTGDDADFAQYLIQKFGVKVYGFEPMRKHQPQLDQLEQMTNGQFSYFKLALSKDQGPKAFYESQQNESGSFFDDHINVKHNDLVTYQVDTIDIAGIFQLLRLPRIGLLKLDVEGAEYGVLEGVTDETLTLIDQIAVEFHHHCIDHYRQDDTLKIVQRLQRSGFLFHTRNNRDYLFWRR